MDSIRLTLAIAAAQQWEVHHMDVKNTFLHGDVSEEIYIEQPHGFIQDSSLVCRLKKSLYGLKQGLRAWYAKMDSFLLSENFERYSDWVGDNIDHKSTSGYSLSLGSGPICWSRKKQAAIALSSVEAEYRGVVNITIQALWLQHFLTELGV
eukprot:PITA_30699